MLRICAWELEEQLVELVQSFGDLKVHARGVGVSERDVNMALDRAELLQLVQAANPILDTQRQDIQRSVCRFILVGDRLWVALEPRLLPNEHCI